MSLMPSLVRRVSEGLLDQVNTCMIMGLSGRVTGRSGLSGDVSLQLAEEFVIWRLRVQRPFIACLRQTFDHFFLVALPGLKRAHFILSFFHSSSHSSLHRPLLFCSRSLSFFILLTNTTHS